MTTQELLDAITVLAACNHFDQSRQAARQIPNHIPLIDILQAADGATQLARALNTARRTAA